MSFCLEFTSPRPVVKELGVGDYSHRAIFVKKWLGGSGSADQAESPMGQANLTISKKAFPIRSPVDLCIRHPLEDLPFIDPSRSQFQVTRYCTHI